MMKTLIHIWIPQTDAHDIDKLTQELVYKDRPHFIRAAIKHLIEKHEAIKGGD